MNLKSYVYVITEGNDYDGSYHIVTVCSTHDRAKAYVKRHSWAGFHPVIEEHFLDEED